MFQTHLGCSPVTGQCRACHRSWLQIAALKNKEFINQLLVKHAMSQEGESTPSSWKITCLPRWLPPQVTSASLTLLPQKFWFWQLLTETLNSVALRDKRWVQPIKSLSFCWIYCVKRELSSQHNTCCYVRILTNKWLKKIPLCTSSLLLKNSYSLLLKALICCALVFLFFELFIVFSEIFLSHFYLCFLFT